MKVYQFDIGCECGGRMHRVKDNGWMLTEDMKFIVLGYCNKCNSPMQWTKSVYELLMLCPTKDGTRAQ